MLSSVVRTVTHAVLFLLLALRTPASAAAVASLQTPCCCCCCGLDTEVRLDVAGREPVEALAPLLACPREALQQGIRGARQQSKGWCSSHRLVCCTAFKRIFVPQIR